MANKIYLEPEELKTICDAITNTLDDALTARKNLIDTYNTSIEGMTSDFVDKLKDSMDISDINADENSIDILIDQIKLIKKSADLMIKIDKHMLGE